MTMLSVRMKRDVDLATWQILKIQDAYHVVGEVLPTMRPYLSPVITDIDLAGRAVITKDGRHYRLHGREGSNYDVLSNAY
jgi:hypothetical protein